MSTPKEHLAGRPAELQNARPHNIVLDDESRVVALELGNGNLSAGVRAALKLAKGQQS